MLWISFVLSLAIVWLAEHFSETDCNCSLPSPVGGMAICVVIMSLLFSIHYNEMIMLSILVAFVLGLFDDFLSPIPWGKLLIEFVIALILIRAGYRLDWFPQAFDLPVSIVWIVAMMNAMNFMDNMDGLAAGLAIIAGAFFYAITRDPLAIIMCGALAGFLLFNYQPASIYMGDSGSLMIGLILALLPIIHRDRINSFSTLLILSVPLLDMARLCVNRPLRRKKAPWKGGRDHISHILAKRMGERRAVIILYGTASIFGFLGYELLP